MSRYRIGRRQHARTIRSGFTIVELLIVIVVIAILAAITTVAYNGIRQRAENAKTLAAVQTYVKGLSLFATNNGRFPIDASYPCLGPVGTTCGATNGAGCFGFGTASATTGFVNDMMTVLSAMPRLSDQSIRCSPTGVGTRGLYYSTDGISITLQYYLKGDIPCSPPSGLGIYARYQAEDVTDCRGTMTLP